MASLKHLGLACGIGAIALIATETAVAQNMQYAFPNNQATTGYRGYWQNYWRWDTTENPRPLYQNRYVGYDGLSYFRHYDRFAARPFYDSTSLPAPPPLTYPSPGETIYRSPGGVDPAYSNPQPGTVNRGLERYGRGHLRWW